LEGCADPTIRPNADTVVRQILTACNEDWSKYNLHDTVATRSPTADALKQQLFKYDEEVSGASD
jgi:hypothetical protein